MEEPLEVRSIPLLLETDMAYVRAGMPFVLHDAADGEPLEDSPSTDGEQVAARVIQSDDVDGRTWVKVELYDQSPCDGEPSETTEGWMPLHDDAGRLMLWFATDC